jgi:hypothetical protein
MSFNSFVCSERRSDLSSKAKVLMPSSNAAVGYSSLEGKFSRPHKSDRRIQFMNKATKLTPPTKYLFFSSNNFDAKNYIALRNYNENTPYYRSKKSPQLMKKPKTTLSAPIKPFISDPFEIFDSQSEQNDFDYDADIAFTKHQSTDDSLSSCDSQSTQQSITSTSSNRYYTTNRSDEHLRTAATEKNRLKSKHLATKNSNAKKWTLKAIAETSTIQHLQNADKIIKSESLRSSKDSANIPNITNPTQNFHLNEDDDHEVGYIMESEDSFDNSIGDPNDIQYRQTPPPFIYDELPPQPKIELGIDELDGVNNPRATNYNSAYWKNLPRLLQQLHNMGEWTTLEDPQYFNLFWLFPINYCTNTFTVNFLNDRLTDEFEEEIDRRNVNNVNTKLVAKNAAIATFIVSKNSGFFLFRERQTRTIQVSLELLAKLMDATNTLMDPKLALIKMRGSAAQHGAINLDRFSFFNDDGDLTHNTYLLAQHILMYTYRKNLVFQVGTPLAF